VVVVRYLDTGDGEQGVVTSCVSFSSGGVGFAGDSRDG
jgi:hypothetical protein